MNRDWKSSCWLAALIIAITVIAYLPVLRAGFIWDDDVLITENRLVKADDGLYRIWFTTEASEYYPLTGTLRWLEWRMWGMSPRGYHVVNVLLHAVNAILVWVVLARLRISGAWLAGLVFALHPVNVATAAWISEQKNTLSMLFYLAAILLFLRFNNGNGWSWYGLSLAAFLLALLSKTTVVMLPVVLLGIVWWTRGQLRWKDLMYSAPFFILSAGLGFLTIQFQYHYRLALGLEALSTSFASRLAVAGSVPWFYLRNAVLPFHLTVIYPKWQINDSHWTSYMLGVVLVSVLTLFWWKRNTWGRPFFFALGYFVVMLFPVMGFFDQTFYRYASVADHWQYYSIIAPIALAVGSALRIGRRLDERGRYWGKLVGMGVLMVLGVSTWQRAHVYADNATLWRDNVVKNPDAYVAHHNLGFALAQAGRLEEAAGQFEEALRIKPDYAEAHYNLGSALAQLGRTQEAVGELEQALRLKPDDAASHNNLANILLQVGRTPEALLHYEYAIRLKPDSAELHYSLGIALEHAGRPQEAIGHYEQTLRLKPDFDDAKKSLERLRVAD